MVFFHQQWLFPALSVSLNKNLDNEQSFFAMDFLVFLAWVGRLLILYYTFISIVGKPIAAENSSNVLRKKISISSLDFFSFSFADSCM